MEPSKVFWADFRALPGDNLLLKLKRLILAAGMNTIDFDRKFAAIKMHFGEPGNLSYLRPNFAKVVADAVKELGGKPYLVDCNTLYVGRRKNAIDHLEAAYENGFNPFATGCPVIIGDGIKGTDETLVPIDGEYVKEAKIGTAVMDADVFISLSHFKGHEATGFGGALKNIGMGCGSRAGKMEQHANGKPTVDPALCVGCRKCTRNCAHGAIDFASRKAHIDHHICVGCGRCIGACPMDAIAALGDSTSEQLNRKIAEYSLAVLKDRPHFHISLVVDVSPYCDCHGENDLPIVPDVGMFASFDPVALDQACADAVNAQPVVENSLLGEREHIHGDHFTDVHPNTNWHVCLEHAEKLGIGTRQYELIKIQ